MKIRLSRRYIEGVETDKKLFLARYDHKVRGTLVISTSTGDGQHQPEKVARFYAATSQNAEPNFILYKPDIEWANDERMVLEGFERIRTDGKILRYEQSWLCRIGWEDQVQPVTDDKEQR